MYRASFSESGQERQDALLIGMAGEIKHEECSPITLQS